MKPTLDMFVPDKYDKARIIALIRRLQLSLDVAQTLQPLTKGDLIYADTNTTLDGLAIGSAGQLLRSTGTLPAWSTLTFPNTITRGGLFYGSASNVASVLAVGTATHILTSDGTDVSWAAPAVPTTITVADTTDSTCFVGLFESATGNLPPKTDLGLTYDATVPALTCASFIGDLTGNADTVTTDDLEASPVTLLHYDGADGSTTITDSGSGAVTFTAFGNAQLDTAQFKFGTASLLLDGTGDYIRGTIGARPAGSWTLQKFFRFNSVNTSRIMTWGKVSPALIAMSFFYNAGASQWTWTLSSDGSSNDIAGITVSASPNTGQWYHVAVEYDASATRYSLFLDGVRIATQVSATLINAASTELTIGAFYDGSQQYFNGWMDETAYHQVALYQGADFTPPTAPFEVVTTTYPMLATAATGSLSPHTDDGLTYNAATGVLTAPSFSGALTGNADTVTTANEATDTTCFVNFTTAASGSLPLKTNTNMTFNSSTGVVTFASSVLTTTDINGGTVDNAVIGGSTAAAITGTTITANTGFMPDANDGAYLGQSGTAFSDLFLASGAVVDFAAGDVVLTHSANTLTLTGGVLVVPDTGLTVGASVPFSDSSGTLTLQNVDALDATTEATIETAIDTLANLVSVQGRTITLADAGANAFFGWQDTDGAYKNLTASEALEIIKTVDGSGSGLDADLLDGNSSAHFATAADLTAHIGDTSDAHDASAISVADSGGLLAATDVEAALAELATVDTVANEATDTTCFPVFVTAATGLLPLKTNVNMTFNSNTGVVTFASSVLTTTDINGGTVDGAVIGGSSAAAITGTVITVNTSLLPDANDGAVIGASGNGFSDVFLASGAVLDFAAGNSVITHSSAVLTVSTGDLRVTTAGTNSASVVTVGGTQTLTSKTLTAPDINGGTADSLTSFSIRSTGAAFDLLQATSEAISANRTISWSVGNADRTITLSGSPTLGDWFDQSVKTTASPRFTTAVISAVAGAQAFGAITPILQANGTGQADSQIGVSRWSTSGGSGRISGAKSSAAGGVGVHGAVSTGQDTLLIEAMGSDGSDFIATANLIFEVGSTVSSGIVSGLWRTLTANSAGMLTEAMRIDDAQKIMFGFITPITVGQSNKVQVGGNATTNGGIANSHFAASAVGPSLQFSKSRNASVGTNTIVQSGDSLGEISWYGADGTNYDLAAQIIGQVAGTPASGTDMPGRLRFLTSPDGSATPLDRLWVEQNGDLQQYALFTSSTDYSRVAFKWATTTLTSVSGATVTATSLIPARANVIGVNTKVTVALGTGSGTTGYQVGDGTDADLWGNVTGTATTTDTDGNDATANPTGTWSASARNVVITANGGNFNGTGSIRVDVFFSITEAD